MSSDRTRHQQTTEGGVAREPNATGSTEGRHPSGAAETEGSPASEAVVESSPLADTASGAQTAVPTNDTTETTRPSGREEVISLTAWRPGFGIRAALHRDVATVHVPVVGPVTLPGFAHLAWYGGVAALVILEIVEPPVAALMVVAKALADSRHHDVLRSFGEAVESGV
jgi:hypothetical protein